MDGGTIANTSSVVLKANGSVGGNSGTGTINAVISDGGVGFSLTKQGAGTTVLGGSNTYTGATIVSGGMLTLANVSALSTTSAITLAGGTTLGSNVDAVVISAPITLGNSGTTSTINAPAVGSTGGTVCTLRINGPIGGNGNLTFTGVQGSNVYGTVILGAASDYAGSTLFTTDASASNKNIFVNLGIDNALPTTTVLTLDGQTGTGTSPGRSCVLNLNGHDQTLAGLTNVTRTLRTQRVRNTSATPARQATPPVETVTSNCPFLSHAENVVSTCSPESQGNPCTIRVPS
jgi:autotransporter-associated beta strand protein